MIQTVDRDGVQRLVREEHAQVVEVLPRPEYEWAHLPGAVHLHLKELTAQSAAVLDRDRPVIVYCSNTECDMSPRAAVRLSRLGFGRLYHYGAGKLDWLSFDLPYEGSALLAGNLLHRDVPTCHVSARLAEVHGAAFGEEELCVVVDDDGVVQGLLRREALHGREEMTAEQAMIFGISTVRPSEDAKDLIERMRRRQKKSILVTCSNGRLLGILVRAEAEAALRERRQHQEAASGPDQEASTS